MPTLKDILKDLNFKKATITKKKGKGEITHTVVPIYGEPGSKLNKALVEVAGHFGTTVFLHEDVVKQPLNGNEVVDIAAHDLDEISKKSQGELEEIAKQLDFYEKNKVERLTNLLEQYREARARAEYYTGMLEKLPKGRDESGCKIIYEKQQKAYKECESIQAQIKEYASQEFSDPLVSLLEKQYYLKTQIEQYEASKQDLDDDPFVPFHQFRKQFKKMVSEEYEKLGYQEQSYELRQEVRRIKSQLKTTDVRTLNEIYTKLQQLHREQQKLAITVTQSEQNAQARFYDGRSEQGLISVPFASLRDLEEGVAAVPYKDELEKEFALVSWGQPNQDSFNGYGKFGQVFLSNADDVLESFEKNIPEYLISKAIEDFEDKYCWWKNRDASFWLIAIPASLFVGVGIAILCTLARNHYRNCIEKDNILALEEVAKQNAARIAVHRRELVHEKYRGLNAHLARMPHTRKKDRGEMAEKIRQEQDRLLQQITSQQDKLTGLLQAQQTIQTLNENTQNQETAIAEQQQKIKEFLNINSSENISSQVLEKQIKNLRYQISKLTEEYNAQVAKLKDDGEFEVDLFEEFTQDLDEETETIAHSDDYQTFVRAYSECFVKAGVSLYVCRKLEQPLNDKLKAEVIKFLKLSETAVVTRKEIIKYFKTLHEKKITIPENIRIILREALNQLIQHNNNGQGISEKHYFDEGFKILQQSRDGGNRFTHNHVISNLLTELEQCQQQINEGNKRRYTLSVHKGNVIVQYDDSNRFQGRDRDEALKTQVAKYEQILCDIGRYAQLEKMIGSNKTIAKTEIHKQAKSAQYLQWLITREINDAVSDKQSEGDIDIQTAINETLNGYLANPKTVQWSVKKKEGESEKAAARRVYEDYDLWLSYRLRFRDPELLKWSVARYMMYAEDVVLQSMVIVRYVETIERSLTNLKGYLLIENDPKLIVTELDEHLKNLEHLATGFERVLQSMNRDLIGEEKYKRYIKENTTFKKYISEIRKEIKIIEKETNLETQKANLTKQLEVFTSRVTEYARNLTVVSTEVGGRAQIYIDTIMRICKDSLKEEDKIALEFLKLVISGKLTRQTLNEYIKRAGALANIFEKINKIWPPEAVRECTNNATGDKSDLAGTILGKFIFGNLEKLLEDTGAQPFGKIKEQQAQADVYLELLFQISEAQGAVLAKKYKSEINQARVELSSIFDVQEKGELQNLDTTAQKEAIATNFKYLMLAKRVSATDYQKIFDQAYGYVTEQYDGSNCAYGTVYANVASHMYKELPSTENRSIIVDPFTQSPTTIPQKYENFHYLYLKKLCGNLFHAENDRVPKFLNSQINTEKAQQALQLQYLNQVCEQGRLRFSELLKQYGMNSSLRASAQWRQQHAIFWDHYKNPEKNPDEIVRASMDIECYQEVMNSLVAYLYNSNMSFTEKLKYQKQYVDKLAIGDVFVREKCRLNLLADILLRAQTPEERAQSWEELVKYLKAQSLMGYNLFTIPEIRKQAEQLLSKFIAGPDNVAGYGPSSEVARNTYGIPNSKLLFSHSAIERVKLLKDESLFALKVIDCVVPNLRWKARHAFRNTLIATTKTTLLSPQTTERTALQQDLQQVSSDFLTDLYTPNGTRPVMIYQNQFAGAGEKDNTGSEARYEERYDDLDTPIQELTNGNLANLPWNVTLQNLAIFSLREDQQAYFIKGLKEILQIEDAPVADSRIKMLDGIEEQRDSTTGKPISPVKRVWEAWHLQISSALHEWIVGRYEQLGKATQPFLTEGYQKFVTRFNQDADLRDLRFFTILQIVKVNDRTIRTDEIYQNIKQKLEEARNKQGGLREGETVQNILHELFGQENYETYENDLMDGLLKYMQDNNSRLEKYLVSIFRGEDQGATFVPLNQEIESLLFLLKDTFKGRCKEQYDKYIKLLNLQPQYMDNIVRKEVALFSHHLRANEFNKAAELYNNQTNTLLNPDIVGLSAEVAEKLSEKEVRVIKGMEQELTVPILEQLTAQFYVTKKIYSRDKHPQELYTAEIAARKKNIKENLAAKIQRFEKEAKEARDISQKRDIPEYVIEGFAIKRFEDRHPKQYGDTRNIEQRIIDRYSRFKIGKMRIMPYEEALKKCVENYKTDEDGRFEKDKSKRKIRAEAIQNAAKPSSENNRYEKAIHKILDPVIVYWAQGWFNQTVTPGKDALTQLAHYFLENPETWVESGINKDKDNVEINKDQINLSNRPTPQVVEQCLKRIFYVNFGILKGTNPHFNLQTSEDIICELAAKREYLIAQNSVLKTEEASGIIEKSIMGKIKRLKDLVDKATSKSLGLMDAQHASKELTIIQSLIDKMVELDSEGNIEKVVVPSVAFLNNVVMELQNIGACDSDTEIFALFHDLILLASHSEQQLESNEWPSFKHKEDSRFIAFLGQEDRNSQHEIITETNEEDTIKSRMEGEFRKKEGRDEDETSTIGLLRSTSNLQTLTNVPSTTSLKSLVSSSNSETLPQSPSSTSLISSPSTSQFQSPARERTLSRSSTQSDASSSYITPTKSSRSLFSGFLSKTTPRTPSLPYPDDELRSSSVKKSVSIASSRNNFFPSPVSSYQTTIKRILSEKIERGFFDHFVLNFDYNVLDKDYSKLLITNKNTFEYNKQVIAAVWRSCEKLTNDQPPEVLKLQKIFLFYGIIAAALLASLQQNLIKENEAQQLFRHIEDSYLKLSKDHVTHSVKLSGLCISESDEVLKEQFIVNNDSSKPYNFKKELKLIQGLATGTIYKLDDEVSIAKKYENYAMLDAYQTHVSASLSS